jgi:hypothetical protein
MGAALGTNELRSFDTQDWASWESIQKGLTICFGRHARIGDHDDAGVCGRSNQSAESLFEFDYRLWQLIVLEWVTARFANRFQAGFQ